MSFMGQKYMPGQQPPGSLSNMLQKPFPGPAGQQGQAGLPSPTQGGALGSTAKTTPVPGQAAAFAPAAALGQAVMQGGMASLPVMQSLAAMQGVAAMPGLAGAPGRGLARGAMPGIHPAFQSQAPLQSQAGMRLVPNFMAGAPPPPEESVELEVQAAFEECLILQWTAFPESARLVDCSVELVLDRSPPGDDGPPPAPQPNAMVKTVPCGDDSSVTIQNMPTGRRFLVSVVGFTKEGRGLRSPWTRAACLRPDRRPLGTSNRDPFSVPRLKCKNCTCEGYLLSFDINSSMAKSRCRRCSCPHDQHEAGGAACPELKARMEAYCKSKGVKSCAPLPDGAVDWTEEECELWFDHKGTINPREVQGRELLRAKATVAHAAAASASAPPPQPVVTILPAESPAQVEGAAQGDGLLEAALHMAVESILRADVIFVGCGGRMGEWEDAPPADEDEDDEAQQEAQGSDEEAASASPDSNRRGAPRLQSPDFSNSCFEHIDPLWFDEDPSLAWGYWLDCRKAIEEAPKPHKGHEIVKSWADRAPLGSFLAASGPSSCWHAAGWPFDRMLEPDGWGNFLQCSRNCGQEPWPEPKDLDLCVDPETNRAAGDFPTCPSCGSGARPGVRFPKGDAHWENHWWGWQQSNCSSFMERAGAMLESDMVADRSGEGDQLLLLDLGCSKGSSVRSSLLQVATSFTRCYKIIRLDPQDTDVTRISSSTIVIPLSVPEALRRMQQIALSLEPEMACFIVRDESGANGAEVSAFADASMRHVCRRAIAALNHEVEKVEEPKFKVMHVHAQGHTKDLGPRDITPDSFLFVRAHGEGEEPPVTFVHVSGLRFRGRNAQLNTRIDRVGRLLVDLIREFSEPAYQQRMRKAEDRPSLQKLIREVHLRVLRLHDFPIEGADARLQQELVMQMQGFLHTGMVTPEMSEMGNQTLELSGYSRMATLPLRRKGGDASAGDIVSVPSSRPAWKRNMSRATCVVLLRHGQREDYVALGEGRGQDWVAQTQRPWDPMLAGAGRKQAQAAGKRLRDVLEENGLPAPSRIFSSPYMRCVETGQLVAQEFGIQSLLIEDGLMEAVCEAWMRQWAVPGAEGRWGGPEHAMMSEAAMNNWAQTVQGPEYATAWLRPEALGGVAGLIWTPEQMAAGMGGPGASMVNPRHKSCIQMRGRGYCWDNFERKEDMEQRVLDTIQARAAQNPGRTMIFVSHGGPTMHAFKALTGGGVPKGSGGMASLSVLRKLPSRSWHWDALLSNDATHSEAFQQGVQ